MKRVWVLGATLLLAGCGLPPTLQVASYLFDGISYLASDKSLTDHAISVAMNEDCALFRVVRDRRICVDDKSLPTATALEKGDVIEVAVDPAPGTGSAFSDGTAFAGVRPPAAPASVAEVSAPTMADEIASETVDALRRIAPAAGPVEGAAAPVFDAGPEPLVDASGGAAARPLAAKPDEGRYLVLGSFRDPAHAARALDLYAALAPRLAPAEIDGRQWHRVVVGPLATAKMSETRRQAAALGVDGSWPVTLCAGDAGPRPCAASAPRRPAPAADVQIAQAPVR